jgi:flagellar motor switch/type III secretory pathway protein FliN
LRANGAIVARGVAVDVDGVFGVRISEIEGERDER